ncbi:MAG: hypothetical protein OHK005_01000 [Candidatus Methylacidiphilales bacterium]
MKLVNLIQEECLPRRTCMLTVESNSGETGFVYFQDGEIIESNTGALWGEKALAVILHWPLVSYDLYELPLGIKRSLWEPAEDLITKLLNQPVPVSLATAPSPQSPTEELFSQLQIDLQALSGFVCLWERELGTFRVTAGECPLPYLTTSWFDEIDHQATVFGNALDSGPLLRWSFENDQFRLIKLQHAARKIIVLADKHASEDGFERDCQTILASNA